MKYVFIFLSLFKGNGFDERFNQTLQIMLVKFIMDKKDVWDVFMDTCVYAYNTSVHESTSFSPFEVMFGAFMPVDIEIDTESPITNNGATSGADIERLSEQRFKTLTMAKMLIQKAQKKQKDVYDRKHSLPNSFSIGEFVLKKDFKRKKRAGGKKETRYVGPYMIMKIHGKGADESSEVRNTVERGKVCNRDLDKQQSEEIEVDKLDHHILWEQLFSSNL